MRNSADDERTGRIRHLNDLLRCKGIGGQVMVTRGVDVLGPPAVMKILKAVAAFTDFNHANDPHGERDCATIVVDGLPIIFKIDYFDSTLSGHSPNPADPSVTCRVMTVMLANDY